jgi:hypothetical protein
MIKIVAATVTALDWITYGTWVIGKSIKDPTTGPVVIQLGLTGLFIHILGVVYLYSLVIQVTRSKKVNTQPKLDITETTSMDVNDLFDDPKP